MTLNTFNHQGVDNEFLKEIQTHRASGVGPFNIRPEHLIARDSLGRSCLHIALLKTRDYHDYVTSLEIYSSPQSPKILGWPSLIELERDLDALVTPERVDPWPWQNLQMRASVSNIPVNFDLVKQLIAAGANVKSVDSEGNYCLHYAVETEDGCELITPLVNAGAKLESSNKSGDTPLLTAVKVNNFKAVEILIKCGADIDALNYHEDTCLHLAGDDAMLNLLLDAGCNVPMNCLNECGCSPFLAAIDYSHVKTVLRMIQAGANVNFQHRKCRPYTCHRWPNPLVVAVARNRDEIVEVLLKHGANPNVIARDETNILSYAASSGLSFSNRDDCETKEIEKTANILQLLITHGANVRDSVESFSGGIMRGNLKVVQLFINEFYLRGLDVLPGNTSLLHLALVNRRDEVFKFIFESNFNDLDHADSGGNTPFLRAIEFLKTDRAKILLDYGADINAINHRGKSALDLALITAYFDLSCVTFLLSYGSLPGWKISMSEFDVRFLRSIPRGLPLDKQRDKIESIIMHLALMESLGRSFPSRVMSNVMKHLDSYRELYEKCKIEIELSQKFFIKISVTVFDMLTKIDHRYARDEDLIGKLNSEELFQHFSIYGSLIRDRFAESQKALERVSASVNSLHRILKIDYQAFHRIYDNILCRLRLIDLLRLQQI